MSIDCRQTIWLVVCVSIACCLRQAVQSAQTGTSADGAALGIVFPQNEKSFLTPQRARQSESNERQKQLAFTRGLDEDEHWQSKRLRLVEPEGEVSGEERIRLNHIRDLLEAITGTIPPSPSRARNIQRSALLLDSNAFGHQQATPNTRYSRPLARSTGVPARAQRRNGKMDALESSLDERVVNSRESGGAKGLVWPTDLLGGVGQYQKTRPTPVVSKLSRSRVREDQLNQKFNLLSTGAFNSGHLYQPEQMARKSHRSGLEEVPIQTPIHSMHPGGDYETKRVENSRGWNNLRGMWGKRSSSEAGEDQRRLQELQLEAETRQALNSLMARQLEPEGDVVGGGDASADYAGAEGKGQQQQWRPLTSAGDQSISPM